MISNDGDIKMILSTCSLLERKEEKRPARPAAMAASSARSNMVS